MTTIRPIPNRMPWEEAPEVEAAPWESAPESPEVPPLLGGPTATIGAGGEEGFWQEKGRQLKEALFGHPDRAEAEETGVAMQPTAAQMVKTALAGGAAMIGGTAAGQLAANPIKAGLALAGSYAGEKAGHTLGGTAEAVGAPKGTRQTLGVIGALLGGGAGAFTKRGAAAAGRLLGSTEAAAAEAAPAAAEAAAPAAGKVLQMPGGQMAAGAAQEIEEKIVALRRMGQSGAQITSSLRQLFGIPPSDGQKMTEAVLEAYFKVPSRVR